MRPVRILLPTLCITAFICQAQAEVFQLEGQESPEPRMEMKKSGVPIYTLYSKESVVKDGKERVIYNKVEEIPELNVGVEGRLDTSNFSTNKLPARPRVLKGDIKVPTQTVKDIPLKLDPVIAAEPTPALQSGKNKASIKSIREKKPEFQFTEVADTKDLLPKELEGFSPSRLKLLQGLIFLEEAQDFPLALGLFAELQSDKEVGGDAEFYLGLTANKVGLKAEFRKRMLKLVKDKNSPYPKAALEELLAHLPANDFHLANEILPHLEDLLGKEVTHPRFALIKAKLELESNRLAEAAQWLDKIKDKTDEEHDRRFLQSVIGYRSGQGKTARKELSTLLKSLKSNGSKKDLRSLAALTLARLYFQIGEYQNAYQTYLEVDKLHPLWMESLVEQSWTQILAQDYIGAAGNMFSLHTETFKNTFKPESHITRTVAYVNLCQYGDALNVLKQFKGNYTPAYKSLQDYKKSQKGNAHYYELVKEFLSTDGDAPIKGVPRHFLFEFAKHPQFVGLQGEINALEDERATLNSVYGKLLDIERVAIKETSSIQKESHEVRKDLIGETSDRKKKSLQSKLDKLERKVLNYEVKRYIANKSRNAIKTLREEGMKVLAKEESYYRDRASKFLATRFDQLSGQLKHLLEQGDLLQYEIFSGAGEHLRYQLAGGEVKEKDGKPVQVAEDEAMKWKYKGEIWEDEVGFFRSSLKNVCAPDDVAQNR